MHGCIGPRLNRTAGFLTSSRLLLLLLALLRRALLRSVLLGLLLHHVDTTRIADTAGRQGWGRSERKA